MRIGMVLHHGYPPDIRVDKEARSLSAQGHSIFMLTAAKTRQEQRQQQYEHLHVSRVPYSRPGGALRDATDRLLEFATGVNNYWREAIAAHVDDKRIDVLHVHDLQLAGTAIAVARAKKLPVVVDLHENFPAAKRLAYGHRRTMSGCLNEATHRWERLERAVVRGATQVIVVVEEARARLAAEHEIDVEKITVVMNTEDENYFSDLALEPSIVSRYEKDFAVTYVGGGGVHRGLSTFLRAVPEAAKRIPNLRAVIVGAGQADREILQEGAERLGVSEKIEVLGWQPFERVSSYIKASAVCVVPHLKNAHTDTTIPHKLFQYMLMEKPVIVSNCTPLERIVKETGAGLVFESGNAPQLSDCIIRLFSDPALRERCASNGLQGIRRSYNWAIEGGKLCALYGRL